MIGVPFVGVATYGDVTFEAIGLLLASVRLYVTPPPVLEGADHVRVTPLEPVVGVCSEDGAVGATYHVTGENVEDALPAVFVAIILYVIVVPFVGVATYGDVMLDAIGLLLASVRLYVTPPPVSVGADHVRVTPDEPVEGVCNEVGADGVDGAVKSAVGAVVVAVADTDATLFLDALLVAVT